MVKGKFEGYYSYITGTLFCMVLDSNFADKLRDFVCICVCIALLKRAVILLVVLRNVVRCLMS